MQTHSSMLMTSGSCLTFCLGSLWRRRWGGCERYAGARRSARPGAAAGSCGRAVRAEAFARTLLVLWKNFLQDAVKEGTHHLEYNFTYAGFIFPEYARIRRFQFNPIDS